MTPKNQAQPPQKILTGSDYEFELKFIPCPPEQRESYWQAMKILNEMIVKAIELSQVNNEELAVHEISMSRLNATNHRM